MAGADTTARSPHSGGRAVPPVRPSPPARRPRSTAPARGRGPNSRRNPRAARGPGTREPRASSVRVLRQNVIGVVDHVSLPHDLVVRELYDHQLRIDAVRLVSPDAAL